MKKLLLFSLLVVTLLSITSCRKGGLTAGQVTFWYDSPGTTATVQLNGETKYVTEWYQNQPDCGSLGCANFQLPAGTYNWTAQSSFSTWSGSVTVQANKCWTIVLY